MFEEKTYKRCACKGPLVDKEGKPVLKEDGTQKIGYLEKRCPKLKRRDHGSWYYSIELPPGPGGKHETAKKGGFRTQKDAATACKEIWELAQGGVQVKSNETVAEFLRRWFAKHVDLKRSTRKGYEDHIERVFIPALGHLKMRDLRTRHIQDMFKKTWADNKIHQQNREAADEALAAERAATQHGAPARSAPGRPSCARNGTPPRPHSEQPAASHATSPAPAPNSR
jgi:hypothetical protein